MKIRVAIAGFLASLLAAVPVQVEPDEDQRRLRPARALRVVPAESQPAVHSTQQAAVTVKGSPESGYRASGSQFYVWDEERSYVEQWGAELAFFSQGRRPSSPSELT